MGPYSSKALHYTDVFCFVKSVNFEEEDQERLTSCQQAGSLAAASQLLLFFYTAANCKLSYCHGRSEKYINK